MSAKTHIPRKLPAGRGAKVLLALVLSVFPFLTVLVGSQIKAAGGEYWQGNIDPSYIYLMDGLNVANLHRPRQNEHPGTPVQVFTGGLIRLLNIASSEQETATKVVTNPEFYLSFTNYTLMVFYALCIFAVGVVGFTVTESLISSLLAQATPFVSLTILLGLVGVRPEIFFLCITMLLSGLILLTFKFPIAKHVLRYTIAFGFLIGVGVASKVTFVPLVVIPLILLPSWKWRLAFSLATIGSFLISIAPIITSAQLHALGNFILATATHTGTYGYGAKGVVDAHTYLPNLVGLIRGDLLSFVLIFGGVVVLVLRSKVASLGKPESRALLAVTAAQFCLLLVVAKHPANRYLIPGLGLIGINFLLVLRAAAEKVATLDPRLYYVPLILVCAVLIFKRTQSLRTLYGSLEKGATDIKTINAILEKESREATVVHYLGASSKVYGLKLGSEYSGDIYAPILARIYPSVYFYNLWKMEFSGFAGPVDISRIKGQNNWWIMHGFSLNEPKFRVQVPDKVLPDDIILDDIYFGNTDDPNVWNGETIYRAFQKTK